MDTVYMSKDERLSNYNELYRRAPDDSAFVKALDVIRHHYTSVAKKQCRPYTEDFVRRMAEAIKDVTFEDACGNSSYWYVIIR